MTTYDYRCPACRRLYEITKPMSQSGRVEHCPADGAILQSAWLHAPAVIFRGKGWGGSRG